MPWQFSRELGGYYVWVPDRDILVINGPTGYEQRPRPPQITPQMLANARYDGARQSEGYSHHAATAQPLLGERDIPRTFHENKTSDRAMDSLTASLDRVIIGEQGDQTRFVRNAATQVQNRIKLHPPEEITDPTLLRNGVPSRGLLLETPGDAEVLFDSYRKRPSPRQFFKVGKVFMVLWAEPAGVDTATIISTQTRGMSVGRYGEAVYSSVRRFVVVREAETYCSALPVTTYHGRGVAKPGVKKSEHAIIYTGRQPPEPHPDERPTRQDEGVGMRLKPIRIDTDSREDKLDPMSRLNFGAIHTIQHNIKVKAYGMVHVNSKDDLLRHFVSVWHPQQSVQTAPQASASRRNVERSRTLDPRIEAEAIQRLKNTGLTEDQARERLSINLNALLAKQGQTESSQASAVRSALSPARQTPSASSVASQKVIAIQALRAKGMSLAEAQQKADTVFAALERRDSVASSSRPAAGGIAALSSAGQEVEEDDGDEDEDEADEDEDEDQGGDDGNSGAEDEGYDGDEGGTEESGADEEGGSDAGDGSEED